MSSAPIIQSLLETDIYKYSMLAAIFGSAYIDNEAEYRFVCRSRPAFPLADLKADVERELDHLCTLGFRPEELDYLRSLRYMKSGFVDFLSIFRLQRRFIRVEARGEELEIVARGPQVHVMLFEIFVLAIVGELNARRHPQEAALAEGRRRLAAKIERLREFESEHRSARGAHPFEFFDFGLRRRFSAAWQEEVVTTLKREVPQFFKGTSNVRLAMQLGLTPIGTMAHEYLQTFQAVRDVPLRNSQKAALEAWVQTYRGDLGIALTDVIGMDAFLRDFDLYFAKLFDNCELHVWTTNCESVNLWTWTSVQGGACKAEKDGCLVFPGIQFQAGGASSCGQLACPQERVSAGEPVRQPAETAARGGRPQAEERVPVPLGARVARAGWLSTGGRELHSRMRKVRRSFSRHLHRLSGRGLSLSPAASVASVC
ncbi:nicotinate phosphoribosyltransferase [Caldimonas tepidiphila]|uniref:nicotinate phosphoribosyltransferase n=1 Tax=Caldimonas tepidiphila TaxID=2315841 RepID=UPI0023506374|nr:nicotinate phosphoribosyltransferase [Caldimonas tepidiphila]